VARVRTLLFHVSRRAGGRQAVAPREALEVDELLLFATAVRATARGDVSTTSHGWRVRLEREQLASLIAGTRALLAVASTWTGDDAPGRSATRRPRPSLAPAPCTGLSFLASAPRQLQLIQVCPLALSLHALLPAARSCRLRSQPFRCPLVYPTALHSASALLVAPRPHHSIGLYLAIRALLSPRPAADPPSACRHRLLF
jgi:hypothetical protein